METSDFYDRMAPFYHLIPWQGFDTSIKNHGIQLDKVIRLQWGSGVDTLLDVSCGIGTQAIGLASLGYNVTASDLSPKAVARAKKEAVKRGVKIDFSVSDMRQASIDHPKQYDVVLSADNSVPHLLNDDEIEAAFRQFYRCCKTGGGCLVSVRDYEQEEFNKHEMIPYGIREENGKRFYIFQVRDYDGAIYDISMFFIEDDGKGNVKTHVMRTKYFAIRITRLMDLMENAGFKDVIRLDDVYFQPIIAGSKL